MVTFIPPYCGEKIQSNAEKKVFGILKDIQMDEVYVLHSLGLPKHSYKSYGEIDFVVVCRRGVACFEVKGGRIAVENGQWLFIDRYGQEHKRNEDPFKQVTGNMYSLANDFKNYFSNNQRLKNIFVACGVMFPDIAFTYKSNEIIPEIVYDEKTTTVTDYINTVFDYWESRHKGQNSVLSQADMEAIVRFLRGNCILTPVLRTVLENTEKQILRLTDEQVQVMRGLYENERLLVKGKAGSGKSLLAMDYAKTQAALGKKVLYLTYNKNLVQNVKSQLAENEHIKIINIHALFGEYVSVTADDIKENAQDFFNKILPQRFSDFVLALNEEERKELQYDVLVMDEGQDILNSYYLESLDMLLQNGFEKGQWVIFYDDMQNIYNKEFEEGLELIKSYPHAVYTLHKNCRNTLQIGQYCTQVSGVDFSDFLQKNGEEVRKIVYSDIHSFKAALMATLKELQKEEIFPHEILLLSPKKYASSDLMQIDFKVNELGDTFNKDSKLPQFATIQGFKGLDAKIVILVDVDKIFPKNFAQYMYLASSRARSLLCVFVTEHVLIREKHFQITK